MCPNAGDRPVLVMVIQPLARVVREKSFELFVHNLCNTPQHMGNGFAPKRHFALDSHCTPSLVALDAIWAVDFAFREICSSFSLHHVFLCKVHHQWHLLLIQECSTWIIDKQTQEWGDALNIYTAKWETQHVIIIFENYPTNCICVP